MSELINNSARRKDLLRHMLLELHEGRAPEAVKQRLAELLAGIPYGEVVEVEQQLIAEGLPEAEILRLCDVHTQVLDGHIDQAGAKTAPPGHPVDTFLLENAALLETTRLLRTLLARIPGTDIGVLDALLLEVRARFNQLMDVDKHYRRKENLLFPYLEKYGITGPPKVMWGKHDETRALLRAAIEGLEIARDMSPADALGFADLVLLPAVRAVEDMTMKEEMILFPMSLDHLTDLEWYEILRQTPEIGFCLVDPRERWVPAGIEAPAESGLEGGAVRLPSGSLLPEEIQALLNALPVDLTFVDRDDRVAYFSQGKHRIFDRNRAILGRDVRLCHPPSSVHIVDRIVGDFRSGRESSAPFWITLGGRFIHIEYFALRNERGEYLGTLEVSQDLTEKRALEGEQRLLSYVKEESHGN